MMAFGYRLSGWREKWLDFDDSGRSLASRSRTALVHDLRHEHGSRLLGWGWSLLDVRDQLGHADVSTTNTYLNAGKHQRQDLMRKTDELRARCNLVANEAPMGHQTPGDTGDASQPKRLVN